MKKIRILLERIIELLKEISVKLDGNHESQPGGPGQPDPDDDD